MSIHIVDCTIALGFLFLLVCLVVYAGRYVKSVADFLAANRCAGRYLLTVAGDASGIGAISVLAFYELYYHSGFSGVWWGLMFLPAGVIIALSGFVSYRFRQTLAMTMAQFFEIRYSRNFRIFAGILAYISGILNYGIFPAVAARFFIYFCGLPENINIFGMSVTTFPIMMIILLSIALFFAFTGGQIAIILTDFAQGSFCYFAFALIIIYLLITFDWSKVSQSLLSAPADASLVNPFRTSQVKDFNFWYFAIALIGIFYSYMAWQGSQGYYCSAISPHEARMSVILSKLKMMASMLMLMVVPIFMYAVMHHEDYNDIAKNVNTTVSQINNTYIQKQLLVPIAIRSVLPTGLIGIMLAMMLAACISADDTYLHSWGSIFIQDIIMPFRKKPLSPQMHMKLLRISILGVAVFAFVFSLLFPQREFILMWFAITGSIFLGGAGSVIIGGLYWKRGTTAAAWTAMIAGTVLSVGGIITRQIYPEFPLNSQQMYGITIFSCIFLYLTVSLLDNKPSFDLDKMLHRDENSIEKTTVLEQKKTIRTRIFKILGITHEFSRGDKVLYFTCFVWIFGWFGVFIIGTIYNLIYTVSDQSWLKFWRFYVIITLATLIIIMFWFGIGGVLDIRKLFDRLRNVKRNDSDDGFVLHKSADNKIKNATTNTNKIKTTVS